MASEASRPMTSSICWLDPIGLGCRQVDLVQDRDNLVVVVDAPDRRWPGSGPRRPGWSRPPGSSPRRRRGCARPRRRSPRGPGVSIRLSDVDLAVVRPGTERRTVWALMVIPRSRSISIVVEHLLGHLALGQRAGLLDQAVRERRLAVVDVGDDREIPDRFDGMRAHERADSRGLGQGRGLEARSFRR